MEYNVCEKIKNKSTIVLILKVLQSELAAVFLHHKLIILKHVTILKEKKAGNGTMIQNRSKLKQQQQKNDDSNKGEISIFH